MERYKECESFCMAGGKEMTQTEKILKYIEENHSITPLEALREFGCFRLASRMCDIKQMGYNVQKTMESAKNRAGEPVRYARYTIGERNAD